MLNVERLIAFVAQYGVQVTREAFLNHLFGHIANDAELTAAQRFMLLSGIESARPQPIAINVFAEAMFTYPAIYIELNRHRDLGKFILRCSRANAGVFVA
ncbi:MAG UNVERIFIED_CONTAM: hypothetical protein LVT10_13390 [Anaerolineae bacterium]